MLFSELVETQLEPELRPIIDDLLALKKATPEIGEMPRIAALNTFIEQNIGLLRTQIAALPQEPQREWGPLNELFLSILKD